MAGGRPTDYDETIIPAVEAYLASCKDEEDKYIKLPQVAGLAVYLKVARSTLYIWAEEHEEFSDIFEQVKAEQEAVLVDNGLNETYNSTITKVMLTKHGYADRQELTGKDGEKLFEEKEAIEKGKAAIAALAGAGDIRAGQ